jgi:hypothetical protein
MEPELLLEEEHYQTNNSEFKPEESIEIGKQAQQVNVPTLKDLSASEDKLGKINEGMSTRCEQSRHLESQRRWNEQSGSNFDPIWTRRTGRCLIRCMMVLKYIIRPV